MPFREKGVKVGMENRSEEKVEGKAVPRYHKAEQKVVLAGGRQIEKFLGKGGGVRIDLQLDGCVKAAQTS